MMCLELLYLFLLWNEADAAVAYFAFKVISLLLKLALGYAFLSLMRYKGTSILTVLGTLFFRHDTPGRDVVKSALAFQSAIVALTSVLDVDAYDLRSGRQNASGTRYTPHEQEIARRILTQGPALLLDVSHCYFQSCKDFAALQAFEGQTRVQKFIMSFFVQGYDKFVAWSFSTIHQIGHALAVVNAAQLHRDFKDPRFLVPSKGMIAACPNLAKTCHAIRVTLHRLWKVHSAILIAAERRNGDVVKDVRIRAKKKLPILIRKAEAQRTEMQVWVRVMEIYGEETLHGAMAAEWGRMLGELVEPIDLVLERFKAIVSVSELEDHNLDISRYAPRA